MVEAGWGAGGRLLQAARGGGKGCGRLGTIGCILWQSNVPIENNLLSVHLPCKDGEFPIAILVDQKVSEKDTRPYAKGNRSSTSMNQRSVM